MRLHGLLAIALVLLPAAATARDVEFCADLYRKLNNAPIMIGNTAQMRQYVQQLADKNIEVRKLRIEMRRSGCGGGSIVALGSSNTGMCEQMRQELQSLETQRETIAAERNSARQLAFSSEERTSILASIRTHACLPTDLEEQQQSEDKERLKVRGLALPKEDDPQSGVSRLRITAPVSSQTAAVSQLPPVPDRPYDPAKKVRIVGPVFLPDQNIDLANPKANGPQPEQ